MLVGLCTYCSKPCEFLHTCWKCGARVCKEHFVSELELCSKCGGKGREKWVKK